MYVSSPPAGFFLLSSKSQFDPTRNTHNPWVWLASSQALSNPRRSHPLATWKPPAGRIDKTNKICESHPLATRKPPTGYKRCNKRSLRKPPTGYRKATHWPQTSDSHSLTEARNAKKCKPPTGIKKLKRICLKTTGKTLPPPSHPEKKIETTYQTDADEHRKHQP